MAKKMSVWSLEQKKIVELTEAQYEVMSQKLIEEYKGLLAATIWKFFPKGIATTAHGIYRFPDLMQEAHRVLFYANTHYHVTQQAKPLNVEDWDARITEKTEKRTTASFSSYLISLLHSTLINLYVGQKIDTSLFVSETEQAALNFGHAKTPEEFEPGTEITSTTYNPAAACREATLLESAAAGLDELEKDILHLLYNGFNARDIEKKFTADKKTLPCSIYAWIKKVRDKVKNNPQLCQQLRLT